MVDIKNIPTPDTPLSSILQFYLETVSVFKRSHNEEKYRITPLSNKLGHLKLSEITPIMVSAYRDERLATKHYRDPTKTLGNATVKHEIMLLSHVFTTAMREWGWTDLKNPVALIRKPVSPPGRTRRLSEREERKLLTAAKQYHNREMYAIIVIALETACRQGEIVSLLWENVSRKKRTCLLPITKNGSIREVPLSQKAYSIFFDYMEPKESGKVFKYTSQGLKSSWRDLILRTGIPDFRFHDLRHMAISSLMERGLNTIEVATISGHRSQQMLMRYTHLSTKFLVPKLDPKVRRKKNESSAPLKEQLRPYPFIFHEYTRWVKATCVDFESISIQGRQLITVESEAKNLLLRHLVELVVAGETPPAPTRLEDVLAVGNKAKVKMISPIN